MPAYSRPPLSKLKTRHAALAELPFSYKAVGATESVFPSGYNHDDQAIYLGRGAEVFEQAKTAIRQWQMYPNTWAFVYPGEAQVTGQDVLVGFRLFGRWWFNGCRIVYTIDEPYRFGFGYGTLPGHVEEGEERFLIEWSENEEIWYRITAFSRPDFWLAKLGYPVSRLFQRRFVRDSFKRMEAYLQQQRQSIVS